MPLCFRKSAKHVGWLMLREQVLTNPADRTYSRPVLIHRILIPLSAFSLLDAERAGSFQGVHHENSSDTSSRPANITWKTTDTYWPRQAVARSSHPRLLL